MRAALLILGKDLRQRLRDRSVLMFGVVLPLGLAFVFNLVIGNVTEFTGNLRYAVVNQDRGGTAAADFVEHVLRPGAAAKVFQLREESSPAAAEQLVRKKKVTAAFEIPPGFSAAVQSGQPATLRIVGDVDSSTGVQVARSLADSYASRVGAVHLAVATVLHTGAARPEQASQLAQRAAALPDPVVLSDTATGRRELDTTTYFAAGMAVFFLFFTVQFGIVGLLDERRQGTLARMLAAPVPRVGILGGKLLTSFVVALLSMTILIVGSNLLMGARWGNPFGVALLVVAGVLAATSVMAVVATLARTSEQASNWQTGIAVVMGALGGAFFPISQGGALLAAISKVTPHYWFLRGLADLSGGGSVAVVLPSVGAMLAFTVVLGTVAVLRLPRMMRP